MNDINYEILPDHMEEAARLYIERGMLPGGFLTAVFENNLVEAYGRADSMNQEAMQTWVMFLYNEAPQVCWGSSAKVKKWCLHQGLFDKKRE